MIYINKNAVLNKLNLTLSQDTTLTGLSSTYSLTLFSDQNNSASYIVVDQSVYPDRYNEFYITGSTVNQPEGYYNYLVTNSNYTGITLELGKCIISGTSKTYLVDTQTDKVHITKYIDTRN